MCRSYRAVRCSGVEGVVVSGGIRHRGGALASTLTAFPFPARRTERADFRHSALIRDQAFAHAKLRLRSFRLSRLSSRHGLLSGKHTNSADFTL